MPFNQELPEWNAVGTKPPQSKLDAGWQIGERPPSGWWNWALNRTYLAIQELQNEAINTDQKGVANGVATLGADGKVPASQLNVTTPADASTTVKGIVMLEDSVSSTSTTKAATPKNVKQAYDLANAAIPMSQKSQPNGITTLDASGKVPVSQLNFNAPTALATQSSNGFMSATDKAALDNAQKKKLTESNGESITLNDFAMINAPGFFKLDGIVANNPLNISGNVFFSAFSIFTGGEITIYAYDRVGKNMYTSLKTNGALSPWRKITDDKDFLNAIIGNKITVQSNANFVGKLSGSTTANPHILKGLSVLSTTLQPPNGPFVEMPPDNYPRISKLDGELSIDGHKGNGVIVQTLFSFNLIEHVRRTYGTIPGSTTSEKVAWLRMNIPNLTFKWWGFCSSAGGNKARILGWNDKVKGYFYEAIHTSSNVQVLITNTTTDTKDLFDANGFVHFIAAAEPSDGTTASVINTDYVELQVELSTDIKTNLLLASQTEKGLMSPSDKVKLDGIEAKIDGAKDGLSAQIGILSGLNTTAKDNLVNAVNELFTFANDGKTKWSSVIGSPLASSDTFTQMQSKTQTIKNTLATNLTAMGKTAAGTETLTELVNKVSISYSAGTSVAYKGGGPADTSSSSMIPYAESNVNMNFTGTARVEFRLISSGTNDAYAQIYKNGTPFGTLRTSPAGGANIVFTEDISVSSGDYIQIYFRTQSTSGSARIMDFFVKLNIAGAVTRR